MIFLEGFFFSCINVEDELIIYPHLYTKKIFVVFYIFSKFHRKKELIEHNFTFILNLNLKVFEQRTPYKLICYLTIFYVYKVH